MKVALTGANGFLGVHLARAFSADNHQVIALVRSSADLSDLSSIPNLSIEPIEYKKKLAPQFKSIKKKHGELDLFIHNAGLTLNLNPEKYFEVNTQLSERIVGSLEEENLLCKEGRLLYISSLTVCGPMGVKHPVSKYGESKLLAEGFFKKSKYSSLIIRPTAIYGSGDYAFLPLLRAANKGIYPLVNRTQKMSMIHAKDLVRIILEESKTKKNLLHVSDGVTYQHSDFVEALKKVTKKNIKTIPIAIWLSNILLAVSDAWHRLIRKKPDITKEKFVEISHDWHSHEDPSLEFSKIPCKISLEEGFQDAFTFYKSKKML